MKNQKHNEPNRKTCQLPLHLLMIRSRQGDDTATEAFCQKIHPILQQFYSIRYFVNILSRSEIQSILNLSLMEFLKNYPEIPPEAEIPRLLKKILKNALLTQTQKERIREKFHDQEPFVTEDDETGNSPETPEPYIADRAWEPEHTTLQRELAQAVQTALHQLHPREQDVLYELYFGQKKIDDLAKEMHYCVRQIHRLHKKGLHHLQKILAQMMPGLQPSELKGNLI